MIISDNNYLIVSLNIQFTLACFITKLQQEGLAVASIARDDPSPLPGMHRDHNALPSQTDGH